MVFTKSKMSNFIIYFKRNLDVINLKIKRTVKRLQFCKVYKKNYYSWEIHESINLT